MSITCIIVSQASLQMRDHICSSTRQANSKSMPSKREMKTKSQQTASPSYSNSDIRQELASSTKQVIRQAVSGRDQEEKSGIGVDRNIYVQKTRYCSKEPEIAMHKTTALKIEAATVDKVSVVVLVYRAW